MRSFDWLGATVRVVHRTAQVEAIARVCEVQWESD